MNSFMVPNPPIQPDESDDVSSKDLIFFIPKKPRVGGVIMKNWPLILEQAIEGVNQAFGMSVTEYGRYLVERGGRKRPPADCHLDAEYERTDQALKAAWQRIAELPKQIAEDVPDPSIRWYLAWELYWNIPGVMTGVFVEEVAAHLLQCLPSDVPDLLGRSPQPLRCSRCGELFMPHLDEEMPSPFLCPRCREGVS